MTSRVAAGAVLVAAFFALGFTVSGPVPGVDRFVADALGDGFQGGIGQVAFVVSAVLGPVLPVAAAVALIAWSLVARRRGDGRTAGLLLRALLLLALCRTVSLAKPLFERVRPREYPDFSFPSGHVVSVASVAFTAVVLCAWLARERLRAVAFCSVVGVLIAALCRVLLDVHWLTDVLGATLGVVGVGLASAALLRLLPAPEHGVSSRA